MCRLPLWFVAVGGLSAVVTLAPLAAADPTPVRLEDAVQLTLSRNERARIADLNVTVSEAGVARARAAFLPILSVNGNDSQRIESQDRAGGGGSSPMNTATATASITQPLLNASAFPLYAQAKNQLGSTRAQTIDDKRQLAFSAAYAFFNVLTAEAVLRAAEQRLDSAKANLADTQARVDAQLASANDATRAEVDLSSAARQVAQGKGDLQNQILQLQFLMNAPVSGAFAPPDPVLQVAQQPVAPAETLVRFALQHRPDVDAKKLAAAAAHNSADEPLLRLIPSIGLSGQAQGTTASTATGRWHDEVVSVSATWTIFDAGTRYADKRSRDASAEIADLNVKQLLRSVDIDVRSAMASLTSAQAAYQTSAEAADAARKSAEETAILYRQGLAKAIELVDANDQRFQAEVALVSAQYSMAAAYLDLRRALGLSPLGTELK